MNETPPRMAFIDSLRLVAAVLVLTQHVFELHPGPVRTWLIPLAPGVAGVALFFFISGYVIPLSARGRFRVDAFMIRRLFRIYPLYLFTLAVMAVAGATELWPKGRFVVEASPTAWLANIFLVADYVGAPIFITVSWTLAVELVWYVVFAMAVLRYGERAAERLDVLLPLAIVSLAALSLLVGVRIPMGRPTMIYAAVIGFQCFRHQSGMLDTRALVRSLIRFGAITVMANFVAFGIFKHPNLTAAQAIGPWLVATSMFLLAVFWRPLRDARLMNIGVLPALGAMSYSIYLLHPIATTTAIALVPRGWEAGPAFALTFIFACIGYHAIERPGIAIGRRAVTRLRSPQSAAA